MKKSFSSEKFSLQWKDFEENVRMCYQELRRSGDFSDVAITCGRGELVRAHKVSQALI